MAIYVKADISEANQVLKNLQQEIEDTNSLINSISNFKNNSELYLKGEVGDAIKEKLDIYIKALEIRRQNSELLYSNISSTNGSLLTSLGNYESIDTDRLEELLTLRAQYFELQSKIDYRASGGGSRHNTLYDYENLPHDITQAYEVASQDIAEVNHYITQINNVSNAAESGMGILNSTTENANEYATEVSNILIPKKIYM